MATCTAATTQVAAARGGPGGGSGRADALWICLLSLLQELHRRPVVLLRRQRGVSSRRRGRVSADGLHPLLPEEDGGPLLVRKQLSRWSASSPVLPVSERLAWLACWMFVSLVRCRLHQLVSVRPLDQQAAGQQAGQLGLGGLLQAHVSGFAGRIGGVPSRTR